MVADPKALQYILQSSGYNFPKRTDMLKVTEMVAGTAALACVHGPLLTWNSFLCHFHSRGVLQEKSTNAREKFWPPLFSPLN